MYLEVNSCTLDNNEKVKTGSNLQIFKSSNLQIFIFVIQI